MVFLASRRDCTLTARDLDSNYIAGWHLQNQKLMRGYMVKNITKTLSSTMLANPTVLSAESDLISVIFDIYWYQLLRDVTAAPLWRGWRFQQCQIYCWLVFPVNHVIAVLTHFFTGRLCCFCFPRHSKISRNADFTRCGRMGNWGQWLHCGICFGSVFSASLNPWALADENHSDQVVLVNLLDIGYPTTLTLVALLSVSAPSSLTTAMGGQCSWVSFTKFSLPSFWQ